MAAKKKPAPKKDTAAELVFEDGRFWLVKGKDRTDVGVSRRYAEKLLAEANA